MIEKDIYVKPEIEVIEFEIQDSIAASSVGSTYYEEIWGSWRIWKKFSLFLLCWDF